MATQGIGTNAMTTTQTADPGLNNNNNSNKRKRGPSEQDDGRDAKQQNTNGDHDPVNYAALLQGIDAMTGQDDSTRTAQAALAAPMEQSNYPEPTQYEGGPGMPTGFEDANQTSLSQMSPGQGMPSGAPGMPTAQQALLEARGGSGAQKPAVGTAEWHQQRKDNHKEVERRRREVINEGIENIAKIVPCTEKNKGAILQRTCQYITELQTQKKSFETERATFEITLKELTSRCERLKESVRTAWMESAKWQQRCREAGLHFDDYDDGGLPSLEEDDDVNVNLNVNADAAVVS
ncbi:basic helix-loop-helix protein [Exophiala dermatitidis]|uniref:BHLH domain-containing protein n=2 Tax=Exophiala dermatitidis TaxID=5970 RepID=H6BZE8_EXODN|nr:uncharacterized protein HMPREF1120_05066 [Exophiala dermatitidis NIH/UT8656]XP_009157473.1 hypothetical protein, variant [Exophiala dermatitidis NIH/UT8656]KAJ4514427.1 basic helix-loop-helix protein [Exophiala dermatitidis]EHY57011.1 hypothetical protein, variant [Exophiala dermatitidis NIH/UT8656]EHY57012.1 hypothetical protein HMPREF1120_05066 [Exophiala dermatitidis NIH/UT8656]KAJ4519974.1 basic helix-loop-helix protein [Exophiala dermatitidis]KAJ4523807.1 basic helix-loop-helix protei